MEILRSPDRCFARLTDFDYSPHYAEIAAEPANGGGASSGVPLRVHYVDEGPRHGPVTVLLHGEPSWSYLYRSMIGPLVRAGQRVVVPDLPGFGRSDKPADVADYSYARLVAWMHALLLDELELSAITLFCQDWGGLIGLRLVAEAPQRFAAVVASNTGLPDGTHRMPAPWWAFHDFVTRTPELPIGMLVSRGCATPLTPSERAAYDAPFPGAAFTAGPRALPGLVPQSPDDPEIPRQQAAWKALSRFERPVVCAFSDGDPITRGGDAPLRERIPGAAHARHVTVPGGHFVQEECGPLLTEVIIGVAQAAGAAGAGGAP